MTEARIYECMVLLDNREVKSNWEALHNSLQATFTKHGAKVLSSQPWGERRLAYPIKRQSRATYVLNYLEAEPDHLVGIRRDLQFNEAVLRNLIVVREEVPEEVFAATEFDPDAVQIEDLPPPPEPETKPEAKPEATDGGSGEGEPAEAAAETGEGGEAPQAAAETPDETAGTDGGETAPAEQQQDDQDDQGEPDKENE